MVHWFLRIWIAAYSKTHKNDCALHRKWGLSLSISSVKAYCWFGDIYWKVFNEKLSFCAARGLESCRCGGISTNKKEKARIQ